MHGTRALPAEATGLDRALFTPLKLRECTLRNRIVASPMMTYSATHGHISDWHLVHLGKLAAGGAGLVFMESTKVDPAGCSSTRDAGIWKDEFIPNLTRIADVIRSQGATPGIQLAHAGRKARQSLPWDGRVPMDSCPGVDHGEAWEIIGPSPVAHSPRFSAPREMRPDDIARLVELWGQAARRADEAGFEVVEIHGGHGYLIHQFLSEHSNQRVDHYGGTLENRMRFVLEVVRRIRQSWPAHKPLFFRASAVDECGWTLEHSVALAKALHAAGVDVIDCSSGGMSAVPAGRDELDYGYQVEYAHRLREDAGVVTMAVGLIVHAEHAETIVLNRRADLVAIGRELLHNPNWPLDAALKLGIPSPFAQVATPYGYWLEKRSQNRNIRPSTWTGPRRLLDS